jgi:hypothetical protein
MARYLEHLPMYLVTIALRDKLKSAGTFNRATGIKKRGERVTLRLDDIHEIVTLNC